MKRAEGNTKKREAAAEERRGNEKQNKKQIKVVEGKKLKKGKGKHYE